MTHTAPWNWWLAGMLGVFFASVGIRSAIIGKVPTKHKVVYKRVENPFGFWFMVAFWCGNGAFFIYLAVYHLINPN
jgi:hypothetical protein